MKETSLQEKKKNRIKPVILVLGILLLLSGVILGYLFTGQYQAGAVAKEAMNSKDILIEKKDGYYVFDGEGTEKALIFYGGAKVEEISYSPLLVQLAKDGIDCFLIDMPFQIAFFKTNAYQSILRDYAYDSWYLGGHSLGGVVAAMALKDESVSFDGILFLASYSTETVPVDCKVLSFYGSNDQVLNIEAMEEGNRNLPSDAMVLCIPGGNHAQFGDYGFQKGDGEATISAENQISYVIENCKNVFLQE